MHMPFEFDKRWLYFVMPKVQNAQNCNECLQCCKTIKFRKWLNRKELASVCVTDVTDSCSFLQLLSLGGVCATAYTAGSLPQMLLPRAALSACIHLQITRLSSRQTGWYYSKIIDPQSGCGPLLI